VRLVEASVKQRGINASGAGDAKVWRKLSQLGTSHWWHLA
jgi:hypothetical protein